MKTWTPTLISGVCISLVAYRSTILEFFGPISDLFRLFKQESNADDVYLHNQITDSEVTFNMTTIGIIGHLQINSICYFP